MTSPAMLSDPTRNPTFLRAWGDRPAIVRLVRKHKTNARQRRRIRRQIARALKVRADG